MRRRCASAAPPYRSPERIGDRMARDFAFASVLDRLAPPLQADGAEVRLAHLLGDAGKLDVQGIKSKDIVTRVARGKQCR